MKNCKGRASKGRNACLGYVATVPHFFDLWADSQERYDTFMRTWMGVVTEQELQRVTATYIKYPPRRLQSNGYTGPITLSSYQRFQMDPRAAREGEKEGVHIALPIGDHLSTATVVPTRRLNIMFTELPTSQGTLSNLSSFEVAAALKIMNYKFSLDGG